MELRAAAVWPWLVASSAVRVWRLSTAPAHMYSLASINVHVAATWPLKWLENHFRGLAKVFVWIRLQAQPLIPAALPHERGLPERSATGSPVKQLLPQ